MFKHFIIELVVLTVLIVALVISLVLLRKRGVAEWRLSQSAQLEKY